MKSNIIILSLHVLTASINAQDTLPQKWLKQWSVQVNGNSINVDNLGDVYVVAKQDIMKYKNGGQLYRLYSNKSLGEISCIDVSNPLKTLVFYRDLSRLVFIDNTLSEQKESIYLEQIEREFASLACTSNDENGFWLFDPVAFTLTRYNQKMQVKAEVQNIHQLTGKTINPLWMIERGNRLFLVDAKNGILLFDIFGTYLKTIPLLEITKLWVDGDMLIALNEKMELIQGSFSGIEQRRIALPENDFTDICFLAGKLYILGKEELTVYEMKK